MAEKFDQLAKLYSEDPAVKENGGQYTLNRNDKTMGSRFSVWRIPFKGRADIYPYQIKIRVTYYHDG